MRNALAVRHVAFEDLGTLGPVLAARGIRVRYFEAGVDDPGLLRREEFDLAVVLGGPIGAYEGDQYPFLEQEVAWLRTRLQQDRPTLGICLGAQLMAAALGARVFAGGAGKEIGWGPLRPGSHAGDSPCMSVLLRDPVNVLHWHGDTFDLPVGSRHLAATERYAHQAFAWGRNGMALQFHAEVAAANLERWFIGHACEIAGVRGLSPDGLRRATAAHGAALAGRAPDFWNAWLDSLTL